MKREGNQLMDGFFLPLSSLQVRTAHRIQTNGFYLETHLLEYTQKGNQEHLHALGYNRCYVLEEEEGMQKRERGREEIVSREGEIKGVEDKGGVNEEGNVDRKKKILIYLTETCTFHVPRRWMSTQNV